MARSKRMLFPEPAHSVELAGEFCSEPEAGIGQNLVDS